MTWLDTYLQNQRISKALQHVGNNVSLLDIGCNKGELLLKAQSRLTSGAGIDPHCRNEFIAPRVELINGMFPASLRSRDQFNCITALAVFEHIPAREQVAFMKACYELLPPHGKLIITVPDKKVDRILLWLKKLKMIEGMNLEQHFEFDAKQTPQLAIAAGFTMLFHQRFQLGLNNLYVFLK